MNYTEVITMRKSVRNYDAAGRLTSSQIAAIDCVIKDAVKPFGGRVEIRLVSTGDGSAFRPSTYGVITGASDYLLMGYADDNCSALSAGYAMEHVVLHATEMGLGTCWIAATFKGSRFNAVAGMTDSAPLKIVSPIGIPSGKSGLLNTVARALARSDKRKPMDKLFFYGDPQMPVPSDTHFFHPLELMRLAPSSTNSQPWRAIVTANGVDFFTVDKSPLGYLNLGIGMCHFYYGCREEGMNGVLIIKEAPDRIMPGATYVASFIVTIRTKPTIN